MKKITITLDEKIATWARVYAAKHNTSLSRLIGELLAERMREVPEYDHAMRSWLAKRPVKLQRTGKSYPGRDELHERGRLR